jgi:hypothetical protein
MDGDPGISGRERTEQRPDQERITAGRGVAWASQLVRYQAAAIAPHQFGYRGGAERRGHEPDNRRIGFECADELGHVGLHRGPAPRDEQHRELRHPPGQVREVTQ